MAHAFTVGVEEEFQIVDPNTWELRSHVQELLASSAPALGDSIKREMHQSIVEVGTKICTGIEELAEEIIRIRRDPADAAERVGLRVAAAGTHPFSNWMDQVISPGERYENIVEELQQLARSLLIFGLHVHVAVPDRHTMIDLMNEARYFLPHLLALSTSSPFWMGRDTGLKSFRTTVFRRFPRTGIPDHFESWSAYEQYVELLIELHSIDNGKKIWWDLRPQVPPDLFAVVDAMQLDELLDALLVLGPRAKMIRDAGAGKPAEDRRAIRFQPGIAPRPERRAGGQRQQVRQKIARLV